MVDLPHGTVTFVFTDIESSTRLLHELGAERYAEALAEHRHVLRDVFARHGGVEVDTQGDAFFYSFPTAPAALEAAREGQERLAPGPIAVRMGVHTGTPVVTDEGYVGEDVHRAARIAASGHGHQVLVSATAAALAAHELRDLGEHRFKDLSAPERIYQLGTSEFPPLKTLYQTNLPVPATPFLGRERELAELTELLAREEVHLLTLTGAGGTGKTRLALQVAGAVSDDYPDGTWWVPLAPLRDPGLVMPTIAQVLGASVGLAEHIGDRRMLLLLDNFEQLVEAGSALAELLEACPRLDVLVTSRERLRLAAEQEYAVPPFKETDGVDFFYARARAVDPGFELDEAVPEICRRLDQLPLALDLAAVRVKTLAPGQILARLEKSLPLLTGGARDLPERQRTLRATIEWSHDLLDDEAERCLFRRLSVFRGGCSLEAAEAVAGAGLETLQSLVDKSLLRRTAGRFWMLESIREYAAEKLEESGEAEELRERHAEHFLALAGLAGLSLEPQGKQDFALYAHELDNARAALDWWFERDPTRALELATALEMLWTTIDPAEGMRWFEVLLEKANEAPLILRAHALLAYASTTHPTGDDALPERLYRESLEAFRQVGDERGVAILLFRLGNNAFYRGEYERAGELAEESLQINRRLGNLAGESQAVALIGELAYARGNVEEGAELIERSADLAGEAGFMWWRARMLRKLVDCLLELDRTSDADAYARESLQLMSEIGDRQMVIFTLARLARIAAETAQPERAGLLWGAIEAEEGRSPMGAWAKERERLGAPILLHEGPDFERGREQGRLLSFEQGVEAALLAETSPARAQ